MPGGVNSPVRAFRAVGGDPIFVRAARGAGLETVDGERLTDYVLSWGPLLLGHDHPAVRSAIQEALARGTSYGFSHPAGAELAGLVSVEGAGGGDGAVGRDGAVRQQRDRSDHGGGASGARRHRSRLDSQV